MTQEEKQNEIENLLHSVKGKGEIPSDIVAEIMNLVDDPIAAPVPPLVTENNEDIRMRMMDEPDWRKRAAMAAMLLSKSLD